MENNFNFSSYLRTPLLVVILMGHTMNFQAVTLQWTSLGERFFTKITFVRSNACNVITLYFHDWLELIISVFTTVKSFFLPVCVLVCLFKSNVSLKPFPQKVHRYRLTSLWHFMCRLRSLCKEKLLSQARHWNLLGLDSHLEIKKNQFLFWYKKFAGKIPDGREFIWVWSWNIKC